MSEQASRRDFTTTLAGTAAALTAASFARAARANDRLQLGVIGCGGMGTGHLGALLKRADKDRLRVVAVCDVYQRRLSRAAQLSGARAPPRLPRAARPHRRRRRPRRHPRPLARQDGPRRP